MSPGFKPPSDPINQAAPMTSSRKSTSVGIAPRQSANDIQHPLIRRGGPSFAVRMGCVGRDILNVSCPIV